MFLHSLQLNNIRSYAKERIDFDAGVTLLAGDIGSGKTTILLALEFALFGILRGKTSPQELLRHGEKEGSVTLHCKLHEKDVVITRALRRRGSTIAQLPGEITIDGVKEELVATELKAQILTLLGYPESLLSKSTNLFRYTVYTPQEQVKHILFESVEERKDVIRKIFQIDKYQTLLNTSSIYLGDVKTRVSNLQGQIHDVKQLEEKRVAQKQELDIVKQQLPAKEKELASATQAVTATKEKLEVLNKQVQETQRQRQAAHSLQKEITAIHEVLQSYEQQLKETITLPKIPEFDVEALPTKRTYLQKVQEKKLKVQARLHELKANKKGDEKALHLQTCPTCKQEVTEEHKVAVKKEMDAHNKKIEESIKKYDEVLIKIGEKEDATKKSIEALQFEREKYLLAKQKFDDAKKRKEKQQLLLQKKEAARKKLDNLQKEKAELDKKVVAAKPVDDKELREQLLQQEQAKDQVLRELSGLQTRHRLALRARDELEATLKQKRATEKHLKKLSSIKHWVQELFTPLVRTMEKRVLLRVYQEFQNYFTQWFALLVPDQELQVRLDEDFSPLVQQNGFDTSIANLSGGEKTGVALAYRLALNKVLNDYFSSLHTKGLLILDEPTDGFSSEQIDRLREVFEEIGVKQLVLVSHEPRLESVADHVIRVQKQQHSSSLL